MLKLFRKSDPEYPDENLPLVHTLQDLPFEYEPYDALVSELQGKEALIDLAQQADELGFDCVIGLVFQSFNQFQYYAFGTPIKFYLDENGDLIRKNRVPPNYVYRFDDEE